MSYSQGPEQRQGSFTTSGTVFNPGFWNQVLGSFPFGSFLTSAPPPFTGGGNMFSQMPYGGGYNYGNMNYGGYPGYGGQQQQPSMPDWMSSQLAGGTAQGRSWDPTTNQWKETSSTPELVWDSNTNTNYFRGMPVPQNLLPYLYSQGPSVLGWNTGSGGGQQGGGTTGGGGQPQTFGVNDILNAYNRWDPQKVSDVYRAFQGAGADLNGRYTPDQITQIFNKADWASGRSKTNFTNVIAYLQDVGQLQAYGGGNIVPGQPLGGGPFAGWNNYGGIGTGYGGGGTGPYGGGQQQPQGPAMPGWLTSQIANGTAQGRSWDPATRSWKEMTGHPDLVWDSTTNTNYYRGMPIPQQALASLYANGPEALGQSPLAGPAQSFLSTLLSPIDLSFVNPQNPNIPYVRPTAPLTPALAQMPAWPGQFPQVTPALSQLPNWQPRDITSPTIPYTGSIPYVSPLERQFQPQNIVAPQRSPEQSGQVDFTSPAAQTQIQAQYNALTALPLQGLTTVHDQQTEQARATLAASGTLGSPAGQGSMRLLEAQQSNEVSSLLFAGSNQSVASFAQQEDARLKFNTQMRDQATSQNQQLLYDGRVRDSKNRLTMAQLEMGRRVANQNADAGTLQMRQQINLAQATQGLSAQVANQQKNLQLYNIDTNNINANAARINEARMFNAGLTNTDQQSIFEALMRKALFDPTAINQMGQFNATMALQQQIPNLNAYMQLAGLDLNGLLGVRNIALGGLQMLQGQESLDLSQAGMWNQYQLGAASIFATQLINLLQVIGQQFSLGRSFGRTSGGVTAGLSGEQAKGLAAAAVA